MVEKGKERESEGREGRREREGSEGGSWKERVAIMNFLKPIENQRKVGQPIARRHASSETYTN